MNGIYKYNLETGQLIRIYEYNGYCLNLVGNTLYFCNEYNQIYHVNIDSLENWWFSNMQASYLIAYDKNIYYRDPNGNNIYKTDFNGNTKELIAEYTEGDIQIDDGHLYYLDAKDFNLYRTSIKSKEKEKIIDETISNFYKFNNKFIYKSKGIIKSFDIENNSTEIIKENIESNFVLNNNNIYVHDYANDNIIKINIETKEEEIVKNNVEKVYRFQSFYNNIYYCKSKGYYNNMSTEIYKINIENKEEQKISFDTKKIK